MSHINPPVLTQSTAAFQTDGTMRQVQILPKQYTFQCTPIMSILPKGQRDTFQCSHTGVTSPPVAAFNPEPWPPLPSS